MAYLVTLMPDLNILFMTVIKRENAEDPDSLEMIPHSRERLKTEE